MKKYIHHTFLFIFLTTLLPNLNLFAQAPPESFNYQAVVRDNSGNIMSNQAVSFRFSILETSTSGTAVYVETHSATTNTLGLVSLEIGGGNVSSGTFSAIAWGSDAYFLKVELDETGGSSYANMGTSQLRSVPYAMYAGSVLNDQVDDADADPANELQNLSISGDTISISNGNDVVLPAATVDTDDQTLSISGDTMYIADGNGVSLSPYLDNTDAQTLSLSGSTLSISGGNNVTIDPSSSNEYNTGAALSGTNLTITDGGGTQTVDLSSLASGDADWTIGSSVVYNTSDFIGIGTSSPDNPLHVLTTSGTPSAAAKFVGLNGPTFGQAGVQGDTDHEGITNLDIIGLEIGLLGVSMGGSSSDNYGVWGHSNFWGGRFNHDNGTSVDNIAFLAGNTYALQTIGTSYLNGDVGIKQGTPLADLHIKQSDETWPNPLTGGIILERTTTTDKWQIWNSNPFCSFAYNGVRVAYVNSGTGAWTTTSDRRFKRDITEMGGVLNNLLQLRPVDYYYNHQEGGNKVKGFIAQDVQKLFPELVYQDAPGAPLALSYADFGVLSVKAIQEQQEIIEKQNEKIENLEAKMARLEKMVEALTQK